MTYKTLKLPSAGALAVILAAFLWSLDGLLRRSLYTTPPAVVVFWEHIFGLLVLMPIVLFTWKKFKEFTPKQIAAILIVSLLSGALGTIFYTAALGKVNFIQFSVVVLLQQLNPLFAITTAVLLLKEKITPRFIVLAVLALIAAYFVSFPNLQVNLSTGSGTLLAALLAIGAAACWGSSTSLSKYTLTGTSFLHTSALRFAFTPFFALLFVGLFRQTNQLSSLTVSQIYTLIGITFSTGLVALVIYYWGLKRIPVRLSAILELTWPLSAILIDYFVFHKMLTLTQWVGALILIGVVYLVSIVPKNNDQV